MSLRKQIKHAYHQIHVPEDVTERLKQELYQKDFQEEEFSDIFQEEEPAQFRFGKYFGFLAAAVVMGVGIGIAASGMMQQRENVFQPAATVPVQVTATENAAEETTETYPVPDA